MSGDRRQATGVRRKAKKKVKHLTDIEVWRRFHRLFLDVVSDLDPLPRCGSFDRMDCDEVVKDWPDG